MDLNPGSDEAIKAGCTCPVMDNGFGRGAQKGADGRPLFWYSAGCPVHRGPGRVNAEAA